MAVLLLAPISLNTIDTAQCVQGFLLLRPTLVAMAYNNTCYENDTDYLGWDLRTVPNVATPLLCQVGCAQ